MNATKKHCQPVNQGTMNEERISIPERKGILVEVNMQYQMRGRLEEMRNEKAEEMMAEEMEREGNCIVSLFKVGYISRGQQM
jgi:hypothetical protein